MADNDQDWSWLYASDGPKDDPKPRKLKTTWRLDPLQDLLAGVDIPEVEIDDKGV